MWFFAGLLIGYLGMSTVRIVRYRLLHRRLLKQARALTETVACHNAELDRMISEALGDNDDD